MLPAISLQALQEKSRGGMIFFLEFKSAFPGNVNLNQTKTTDEKSSMPPGLYSEISASVLVLEADSRTKGGETAEPHVCSPGPRAGGGRRPTERVVRAPQNNVCLFCPGVLTLMSVVDATNV